MSKAVLTKEEAEKVAVVYAPRRFPATVSASASDFVAFNTGTESSFRIDRLVAEQTGIAEIERLSIEEKVEREALTRLKELQEDAYQQAYQLGLDEGREKAFQENQAELQEKIRHLEGLLQSVENLKVDLVASNETHIVKLIYYMAKRVVLAEVNERQELVLEVVRQAVQSAQSEENVRVRVSHSDFEFIETAKEKLGKDFDSIKRAQIEASDDITNGGCIVETNYGDVNATLEQRLEKLWNSVAEKLPKVHNIVSSGNGEG